MAGEQAAFRASWTRGALTQVEARLPQGTRARLLARIGEEPLERLEQAGPLEWLPAEAVQAKLCDALFEELGASASRGFWREVVREAVDGRLLKAVYDGVRRTFGAGPGELLRALPLGWEVIARNAGAWRLAPEPDAKRTLATWSGGPAALFKTDACIVGLAGAMDAVLTLASGTRGAVAIDLEERARGKIVYQISWH